MPPSRSRARFLLLALLAAPAFADLGTIPMGRCVGGSPASPPPGNGGPAFDFRGAEHGPEFLSALGRLGFRTDEKTGTAEDAQGRTVTAAYVEWLSAPADFSQERMPASTWSVLLVTGYRLDEKTCRLAKPSEPPLTRLDVMATLHGDARGMELAALESLKVKLAALSASAPVPESVRSQMKTLQAAGVKLPPNLSAALMNPRTTVGALARGVDGAYLEQTRFFDGQRDLKGLAESALPKSWTPGVPAGAPLPVAPAERKLGDALSADFIKRFGATASGRELLERFRGKDGKIHLPAILVLKANQRPDENGEYGAFFQPGYDTMVINHWQVESILLARLPAAERARVARGLSDPQVLSRYLEQHPQERAAVMGQIDEIFYHELVHAWQDRRDRLDVEQMRGNAPGYNPLAKEYEAYRLQCRYDFDKAGADPDGLMKSGSLNFCLGMLKDYDSFRDSIARLYMGSFAGSQELGDVVRIQAARESAARRLMGDGLYMRAVESLKLAGLWHGDAALKEAQADYAAREREFIARTLPEIRRRALAGLFTHYEREGRWHWAALILAFDPVETPGYDAAMKRWTAGVAPTLLPAPKDAAALAEQTDSLSFFFLQAAAKRAQTTPALVSAYVRDLHASIKDALKRAAAQPAQRAALLAQAEYWAGALPQDDPDRARVAAAKRGEFK